MNSPKNFIDLSGKRFGMLTIIKRVENANAWKTQWLCKCDCGTEKVIRGNDITTGKTISCGCFGLKKRNEASTTHGMSKTRMFRIHNLMKDRCSNPHNPHYKYYGGRGITVCDEWKNDFMNFYNWAIDNGYSDELTIDRVDNNGNYEPNNCRWATTKQQANNTSRNRIVEFNGEIHNIKEWGEILGLS